MGFSVTIASSIVLIGIIVVFSSFTWCMYHSLKMVSSATNFYFDREKEKLDVSLKLEVNAVNARSCNLTVKNTGCRTLFFKNQNGFKWNTVVISYSNNSQWRSCSIEDYQFLEIRVSDTNMTFNVNSHIYINPGEEALISTTLPEAAPDIPINATVCVAFATYLGVTARTEAVRGQ